MNEKHAHLIMGALNLCDSEGVSYHAHGVFDSCQDQQDHENELVAELFKKFPDVVRHERYGSLESVKKAVAS